jgi:hypothetical protein
VLRPDVGGALVPCPSHGSREGVRVDPPYATSAEIENEVLALRKRFPSWGARKLKARLERMNPNVNWPAASTVGQILSRAGLTRFACAALRFASPFPLPLRFVSRVGEPPPLALATPRLRQEAFGMYVHAAARFKGKGQCNSPRRKHQ